MNALTSAVRTHAIQSNGAHIIVIIIINVKVFFVRFLTRFLVSRRNFNGILLNWVAMRGRIGRSPLPLPWLKGLWRTPSIKQVSLTLCSSSSRSLSSAVFSLTTRTLTYSSQRLINNIGHSAFRFYRRRMSHRINVCQRGWIIVPNSNSYFHDWSRL